MKSAIYEDQKDQQIHGYDQQSMQGMSEEPQDFQQLVEEVRDSFSRYLHRRPLMATTLIFLTGFYLGWKAKPW